MIRIKMTIVVSSCHSKTNYNQQRSDPPPFASLGPRKIATVLMKFDLRLRKMKRKMLIILGRSKKYSSKAGQKTKEICHCANEV